jgi:Uma2 family endonuclease
MLPSRGMVQALASSHERPSDIAERRFLLSEVPWWMYVALRDALGDDDGTRMTYLEGALELMSPSILHEDVKTILARLLEVWAMERDVDLRGFGATTFRKEAKRRGLEPDECYTVGPIGPDGIPDLAIEVVFSSPLIDKLEVYAGLGVPEVWVWRDGALVIHRRAGDAYEESSKSAVLPNLDVALLARFITPNANQTQLAKAYQAALRESR